MTLVSPERFAGALVAAALVLSVPVPAVEMPERPAGRVSDYAGLLRPEDRERIEARLEEFERRTTHQVVVAIFRSLAGEDLDDFTNRLFERWRLGQKGKDNGVLLLIDLEGRRARIEVGYGLEPSLTDALSRRILERDLFPRMRARDPAGGITAAVESILAATGGERPSGGARSRVGPRVVLAVFLVSVILFFLAISFLRRLAGQTVLYDARGRRRTRRRGRSWWTVSPGGWGGNHTWGGSGGGFSGGGSSGGGFSGGGGLSGGGGASGSW